MNEEQIKQKTNGEKKDELKSQKGGIEMSNNQKEAGQNEGVVSNQSQTGKTAKMGAGAAPLATSASSTSAKASTKSPPAIAVLEPMKKKQLEPESTI